MSAAGSGVRFLEGGAVQIAYHTPDPPGSAVQLAQRFGWGPFFYLEHIGLSRCQYRGAPATFDHSSAYGQAGELMVELITQHDESPSVLRDLYRREQVGVHHVAHFVGSLEAALAAARADGFTVALEASTATGTAFAMIDTSAQLGHMIELYERRDDLARFYRFVRKAADAWDGREPLRRLAL
jgi:catechol 2,3-dioxygenase-like lactoylglutathione lyase family enzyme